MFLLLAMLTPVLASPQDKATGRAEAEVPFLPMQWERLPDMTLPRAGHKAFVADGQLVVVGGHTDGFVRTATAEYLQDDGWHIVKTLYPHDCGVSLRLPDGDWLVGGGSSDDFGIGQTFGVERYNPEEHSFSPFPILDVKRAIASAALLPSGEILVAGNWYADDALGLSDGIQPFETVQNTAQNRSNPYIFPYGKREAVIFGSLDLHGEHVEPIIDRLGGEAFTSELLSEWRPWGDYDQPPVENMRLVDPVSGQVLYLFRGENAEGRQAILSFSDGMFTKVDTDYEIPSEGPWGPIFWFSSLFTDSRSAAALIAGQDEQRRVYLLVADCQSLLSGGSVSSVMPGAERASSRATVKVYYTHPIKDFCCGPTAILPDGRIVVTGGIAYGDPMGNYNPSAAVFAFSPFEASSAVAHVRRWLWFVPALLCILACGWLILRRKRRGTPQQEEVTDTPTPSGKDLALYSMICDLMEGEQLFRQPGLTIADLASRLRSNTKYISNAISAGAGCGFTELLNGYRIREAEKMLLTNPTARMSEISEAVGYANESSFFRNFKLVHGCTPQQWLAKGKQ